MSIFPTLAAMAEVYRASREGGRNSPRFTAYITAGQKSPYLAGYNPMAGPAALEAVQALMDMDAEGIAGDTSSALREKCRFPEDLRLAIVVASAGMWTDRLATEVHHRFSEPRPHEVGVIQLWTREPVAQHDVRRETAAEMIRGMWTSIHGEARSLRQFLAREGLAYAPTLNPDAPAIGESDSAVDDAMTVLGDSSTHGEIVALFYGDEAAFTLGHTSLGLHDRAGYRWAAKTADDRVRMVGPADALRNTPTF